VILNRGRRLTVLPPVRHQLAVMICFCVFPTLPVINIALVMAAVMATVQRTLVLVTARSRSSSTD